MRSICSPRTASLPGRIRISTRSSSIRYSTNCSTRKREPGSALALRSWPMTEPLRVVALGGGTGLSTLLRGLKHYANPQAETQVDITAIVTVTDDGGSSGRLRRDFDVLPPGDIRNCMVALSEDAGLLSQAFPIPLQERPRPARAQFRQSVPHRAHATSRATSTTPSGSPAKCSPSAARSFLRPWRTASWKPNWRMAPSWPGKRDISRSRRRIMRIRLSPRRCRPVPETLDAIASADLITFGPGSLFTSVIPNLLVSGIPAAIERSPAVKAYFVNLMWQPGETSDFRASDHVRSILRHAPEDAPRLCDPELPPDPSGACGRGMPGRRPSRWRTTPTRSANWASKSC